jgi:hypothetical protein
LSDHTTALVPVETWAYQSPELRNVGWILDLGLIAESLIYYDRILLNVPTQPQLARLFQWLIEQESFEDFLGLVKAGEVVLYDYSFVSAPVLKDGVFAPINLQDEIQSRPNTFEQRFLYHPDVEAVLPRSRHRRKIYPVFRGRVIEVKADEFGSAVANAVADARDPKRAAAILQAFVEPLFKMRGGTAPIVKATVVEKDGLVHTNFNVDLDAIAKLAGPIGFHRGSPLAASINANRYIWSASRQRCDLFLQSPIDGLVGDKLYEAVRTVQRPSTLIQQLQATVEFPDVRALVNRGQLSFSDALAIRSKAGRFRNWLQNESERDRDAIIAYHNEVARESGLVRFGRRSLSLLGVIGSGALGGALGALAGGPAAGGVAGAGASALGYLLDIGSRVGSEWRPVVFGNWYRDRIERLLREE